ncbi:MAG: plastocyanin/azurin family copper-binding protein [Actinomycetota bacterium]|nr:plastocyanin/azurin family copper-binding protein [Actinomycetota bacterium]
MSRIRKLQLLTVLALGFATVALWPAVAGAGGGCYRPPTQGEGGTVEMSKLCFTPGVLHTDPGTEVTFVNQDPIVHNVSANRWGSPDDLRQGQSFTATFAREGIYPFACTYHYGMAGAVVVGDGLGAGSGRSVTVQPLSSESEYRPPQPTSVEQAGGLQPGPGARPVGLVVAGGLGLLVGAAIVAVIRRRGRPN